MRLLRAAAALIAILAGTAAAQPRADSIPLPEHPRPDFHRAEWVNLNGPWRFRFDPRDGKSDTGDTAGISGVPAPNGRVTEKDPASHIGQSTA